MKRYIYVAKQIYNPVTFHNFDKTYGLPYMVTNSPKVSFMIYVKNLFTFLSSRCVYKSKGKIRKQAKKFRT